MTMSWTASLFPGVLLALVAAIAGGVLGGYIGRSFDAPIERERIPKGLAPATAIALVLCLALPLPISTVEGTATVSLDDPQARTTSATVRMEPAHLADGAEWLNVTAWQGGGSVIAPLEEVGPGEFRSEEFPIHDEWKALIRLHTGSAIVAVPLYLPADPAIPAPAVEAEPTFTREFVPDKQILLREAKDTPQWMSVVGNSVLGLIVVVWITVLAWGLRRLDQRSSRRSTRRRGYVARSVRLGTR